MGVLRFGAVAHHENGHGPGRVTGLKIEEIITDDPGPLRIGTQLPTQGQNRLRRRLERAVLACANRVEAQGVFPQQGIHGTSAVPREQGHGDAMRAKGIHDRDGPGLQRDATRGFRFVPVEHLLGTPTLLR